MKIRVALLEAVVICSALACLATAQDFQQSYNLPGGAGISIRNVAGNISVAGYDGAFIVVIAYKQGRDRDRVEIVDASGDDHINVYTEYPRYGGIEASVEFEVKIPRGVQYNLEDISSVSGDVNVTAITGPIHAASVSGDIEITDLRGNANASSVSGEVYVQIFQDAGSANMKFASISGDVVVHAPSNLDALVEMSTLSGWLWTDFPIRRSGRWPFWGRSARGRLGSGDATLRISSISGRVCLLVNP